MLRSALEHGDEEMAKRRLGDSPITSHTAVMTGDMLIAMQRNSGISG